MDVKNPAKEESSDKNGATKNGTCEEWLAARLELLKAEKEPK